MKETNLLTGQHVSLRAMEPEDLEALYTIENDSSLWDVSSTHIPYSRYTLKQFIAKGTHDIYTDKQLRLMIESTDDGTVVGIIDLVDFQPYHHKAEIGIVIARDYRHKGIGAEVLHLIEQYASRYLQLHQLYAYVSTGNEASIKLFQKADYKHTATLEQWIYQDKKHIDVLVYQKFL